MKIDRSGTVIAGLGLLFLLAAFTLLISQRSSPVALVPATPVVNSVGSATASVLPPTEHSLSLTQVEPVTSPVSSTVGITTSHIVSARWQQFSSKTAGYTLLYPQNSMVSSLKLLPSTIEHTQITLPSSRDNLRIIIDIRVYDNSLGNTVNSFLAGLYEQIYGKTITDAKLQELMSRPLTIAGTTGYELAMLIGSTELQIVIPHKNNFYFFTLVHEFGPVTSSAEDIEKFKHVVNTINFK